MNDGVKSMPVGLKTIRLIWYDDSGILTSYASNLQELLTTLRALYMSGMLQKCCTGRLSILKESQKRTEFILADNFIWPDFALTTPPSEKKKYLFVVDFAFLLFSFRLSETKGSLVGNLKISTVKTFFSRLHMDFICNEYAMWNGHLNAVIYLWVINNWNSIVRGWITG